VDEPRRPDPIRQRTGRLGALAVHARGRTNTGPARRAWEEKLLAEVDPSGELSTEERQRRLTYLVRDRMTRMAMLRWSNRTKTTASEAAPAVVAEGHGHDRTAA
jgi:hypothetical protein